MAYKDESAARHLFSVLWGERYDFDEEHMEDTPKRFAKALTDLTTTEEFTFTTFPTERDEMVVMRDIEFHSLCAHHVLPFIGTCHVAYIPNGKIVGLSKIPRTVERFAADLQVQEELTVQIAEFLQEALGTESVAVIMEAEHLCMSLRGVRKRGSMTITSSMSGAFGDHTKLARQEFMGLIGKG